MIPRVTLAGIQHRAVGAEQVGAQPQVVPQSSATRTAACCSDFASVIVLRVVGCGMRQPNSSEIAKKTH